MKENIKEVIIKEKKKLGRALNEYEIYEIIKRYNVNFLSKTKLIKEGKSGINDVEYFYEIWNKENNNQTEEQRQFLSLSIDSMEKRANDISKYIDNSEFPDRNTIDYYNDYLMKLLYFKKICGLPIDTYRYFIDAHKELYDEIFGSKMKKIEIQ
jgi:hypothetical protein